MQKRVLYIGMDESNHGETKPKIGEVVVAAFSYNRRFWENKKHANRRDFSKIEELANRGISYCYTILPHELAKPNYSNLPLVAPFLVGYFLNLKGVKPEIKLGFDGQLSRDDKSKLSSIFLEGNCAATIVNFIKKNGVHYGPELIYLAHLIANSTMNKSLIEIAKDTHYIPF